MKIKEASCYLAFLSFLWVIWFFFGNKGLAAVGVAILFFMLFVMNYLICKEYEQ